MSMRQTLVALREKAIAFLEKFKCLPPTLARLTLAIVFVQSGWGKLHHLENVIAYFDSLGIPFASIQAPFVATTEVLCGLALGIGLLSRLACIPVICMMIVAIITARKDDLSSLNDLLGFIEYLYIVLAVWIAVAGPGTISLDHLLFGKRKNAS
jgi:putative oxidoreductase